MSFAKFSEGCSGGNTFRALRNIEIVHLFRTVFCEANAQSHSLSLPLRKKLLRQSVSPFSETFLESVNALQFQFRE